MSCRRVSSATEEVVQVLDNLRTSQASDEAGQRKASSRSTRTPSWGALHFHSM